jgi:hypothetical protein
MKASLENDLLKTEWIRKKCRDKESYAQNLYAAMCNNLFYKNDEEWSCSWRYAGGIVADLIKNEFEPVMIRDHMDYLDWYCSGIGANCDSGYVSESVVTPEITNDLLNLGWIVKSYPDEVLIDKTI